MRVFLRRRVTSFDIFFCFLTNKVFLRRGYVWKLVTLDRCVFFSLQSCFEGRTFFYVLKFFYRCRWFWDFFWRFVSFDRQQTVGFFLELELVGLGFRMRRIMSNLYRFFWGYANYIYLFVPRSVAVEYFSEERVIFFFGLDSSVVNGLATYLMLLKRMSSYRVTGFVKPGKVIRLKSGKQR